MARTLLPVQACSWKDLATFGPQGWALSHHASLLDHSRHHEMAQRHPPAPGLTDLTDDLLLRVIEAHGDDRKAKMALTSANRRLRHLGNTAVPWHVELSLWPDMQQGSLASLGDWLARKHTVLRRLFMAVHGIDWCPDPADVATAKALLAQLAGGSLRSLYVALNCFKTPHDASFGIDTWAASFPGLQSLSLDLASPTTHPNPAALSQLTALQSLAVTCDCTYPGGLGHRGQAAILPPSLTSLELYYVTYLPRLDCAPGLRRLWVDNADWDVYPYQLDASGLEVATALTALAFLDCIDLPLTEDQVLTSGSGWSDSEDEAEASLVPLAALPHLQGLTLQNCGLDDNVHCLALATTALRILNVCYNNWLPAVPLGPGDCSALQRLCCDLAALAGSGDQLAEMPALEEVDVLWRSSRDGRRPSIWECEEARDHQAAALAALCQAPWLRLVGLAKRLACVLGGSNGEWTLEAEATARAAWQQELPGAEVVEVHTHVGKGRRMPEYGGTDWEVRGHPIVYV